MPVAPVVQSGRGEKPVPPKAPVPVPQAPPAPKPPKKIAQTAPSRQSSRQRKPVEKLQLDHSKYQTYAAVCKSYMPNACPSPSQQPTRA